MKTEYTISQIAEKLHITTNKIRFYEKKGLLTPMRESQNRYRKFGEEDIFRLETILLYRSLGLSIEAIQNILQCNTLQPAAAYAEEIQFRRPLLRAALKA